MGFRVSAGVGDPSGDGAGEGDSSPSMESLPVKSKETLAALQSSIMLSVVSIKSFASLLLWLILRRISDLCVWELVGGVGEQEDVRRSCLRISTNSSVAISSFSPCPCYSGVCQ